MKFKQPSSGQLPFIDRALTHSMAAHGHNILQQERQAEHLSDGPIQQKKTDSVTLQQYSTTLLMGRLPAPPCRILGVGTGLTAICASLDQKGYQVCSLLQEEQNTDQPNDRIEAQPRDAFQRLEDLAAVRNNFDVLLFQESVRAIEPLSLFNKGLDLLPVGGSLLIMDEFSSCRQPGPFQAGLHLLEDFLALAKRMGFELVEQLDLSVRETLVPDHQEKYESGQSCYVFLYFVKQQLPTWRLQLLGENHIPDMLVLFEQTFGHSMSPAMWRWKYGAGRGHAIGAWREGRLIAHYGGMVRKILYFGQPQTAVQIGDVMVDKAERGTLTKKGPFFLMAATFLERYIGYGKPYLLGFGFPNERAMKVAERLHLYAEVGHMVELEWPPLAKTPHWQTRLQVIDKANAEQAWVVTAIDQCWWDMSVSLREGIVGIRDWRYLQKRYLHHPHHQYQVVLVINRFGGKVRGVLVLRHDSNGCEIVDLVAPLNEIPLLVIHARRVTGISGDYRLFCRITERFIAHFTATGGIRQTLDIHIPTNIWSAGPTPTMLRDHWWLMSGDTDFR
nr:GNAT family N-acetyltransferase [Nitrosomonas nitrosa]